MDPTHEDIVKKCLKLQEKEQEKKKLEAKCKLLREEIMTTMQRERWTAVDLPGQLRVSLVEYTKESVSTRGIEKLKKLLTPEDIARIIITKESVDKEGLKHVKALLDEEALLEVIDLSPRSHITFTDRDKS